MKREHENRAGRSAFYDLFDEEEARGLEIRADLMTALEEFIGRKKMTQREAADFFGIPQPKISYIVNGKIEKCTIDYLVKLLTKADKVVTVKVGNRRKTRAA